MIDEASGVTCTGGDAGGVLVVGGVSTDVEGAGGDDAGVGIGGDG